MPRFPFGKDGSTARDTRGRMKIPLLVRFASALCLTFLLMAGCNPEVDPAGSTLPVTNAEPIRDFGSLALTDPMGASKSVSEWADGKHLVMIVSRGYFGTVCPYCSSQAHDLAMDYSKIQELGANLVLVFPVENKADGVKWQELQTDALEGTDLEKKGFPFPVVVDSGLAIVERLGIRGQLARPSTFILDSAGNLRFQYVGRDPGDRPRVGTILEQLKQLN